MITCPNCKESKGLVCEQPGWVHGLGADVDAVTVESYCTLCGHTFETVHILSEAKDEEILPSKA